jgi:hypothetical protein
MYAGQAYHAPVELDIQLDGGSFVRVFTGVLKTPQYTVANESAPGTVALEVRSRDELLLNKRVSTGIGLFRNLNDDLASEREIIEEFLIDSGMLAGTDWTSDTLDPGLFVIPWAWMDDESPVEEAWQLAAACGGQFYCDVDGLFTYENLTHWLRQDLVTPVETLTPDTYAALASQYNDRDLYAEVIVETSPRSLGPITDLWSLEAPLTIGSGETRTVTARFRQPSPVVTGFEVGAATSGGVNMSSVLLVNPTYYAQRAEFEITNPDPAYAVDLLTLIVNGIALIGRPSQERRATSTDPFWGKGNLRPGRTKLVRGNPYLQTDFQAGVTATFLLDRLQLPALHHRCSGLSGVPTRRLGQHVAVNDSQFTGGARSALITAITFRLDKAGFWQDLELIDIEDWPQTNYFKLGSHNLDTAGYKLFY